MNLVRTQFDRIQAQILELTPSQKMLTASLLTIMVMTLFYWVHYAASPEYQPVLDQSLSTEDSGRILSFLQSHNYDAHISGDRVLVPADKQMQAVAELSQAQMMPQNTADGFDTILKDMNPFDAEDKTEKFWNEAKQITLGGIMRRWDGVADATVLIDDTSKRGLSVDDTIQPSAAVNIRTRDNTKPNQQLADAAVRFVAGAVAGLSPDRVSVIINGTPINTDQGDGLANADRVLGVKRDNELYLANEIKSALPNMNAPILVAVHVEVDNSSISKESTEVDPKNSLYKPIEEENTSDETTAPQPAPAEPGVGANIQANVAAAGSAGNNSTKTMENNKFTLLPSQTTTRSVQAPGKVTVVTATVQLPRTYFVACYKQENPGAKDPDAAALQTIVDKQMPDIKGTIRGCTGLADDAISVGLYDPITTESTPETLAVGTSQTGAVSTLVTNHVKDIAVAALAFVSLFMVSMMVRKSTPQPLVVPPPQKAEPQTLEAGEAVAGEAGDGNPLLDGMELDDDAIKTQQMIGQVSQMVKENPDGAANLVKRWLNHA
jgi:flagellar biosynthesis/type III secretory pathway M-ring protein FliF/YscJ